MPVTVAPALPAKKINFLFETSYDKLPDDLHSLAEKSVPGEHLIEEEIFASYLENLSKEPFIENKEKRSVCFTLHYMVPGHGVSTKLCQVWL